MIAVCACAIYTDECFHVIKCFMFYFFLYGVVSCHPNCPLGHLIKTKPDWNLGGILFRNGFSSDWGWWAMRVSAVLFLLNWSCTLVYVLLLILIWTHKWTGSLNSDYSAVLCSQTIIRLVLQNIMMPWLNSMWQFGYFNECVFLDGCDFEQLPQNMDRHLLELRLRPDKQNINNPAP